MSTAILATKGLVFAAGLGGYLYTCNVYTLYRQLLFMLALIDPLFIFGESNQRLHDLIASSRV